MPYLHDSGPCCCTTYFKCLLTPLCTDFAQALWVLFCLRFVFQHNSVYSFVGWNLTAGLLEQLCTCKNVSCVKTLADGHWKSKFQIPGSSLYFHLPTFFCLFFVVKCLI